MRPSGRPYLIVIALAILMVMLSTAPALAAETAWRGIAVMLYDIGFGKTPTLVVSGTLGPETSLPATVELPVPAGCDVGWVGEVFGGDQSQDRVAPFTVRHEDGYDVLLITVSQAHVVQAELAPPADWVSTAQPGAGLSIAWTAHDDVPGVLMGFELDRSMHAEDLAPASAAATATATGVHYSYETTPVPAGTVLAMSASIVEGPDPVLAAASRSAQPLDLGGAAEPIPTPTRTHTSTPILVSLMALAVGALIVVMAFNTRRSAREGASAGAEASPED